ncbi:MAG: 16S rRNA (guanine(966)-N(2))-methyltransferase RsmD [bacterium]
MRIISGEFRGRILSSARDHSIRPTTDRAKQTIFDILSNRIDLEDLMVLDLFAGSGSLGLEALSRGARHVVFIEKSKSSISILEQNIQSVHCEQRSTVHSADVFWYLKHTSQSFDLIFADPPYKLFTIGEIPDAIYHSSASREGSYVVMEHSKDSSMNLSEAMYEITKKPFGQTTVLILHTKSKTAL